MKQQSRQKNGGAPPSRKNRRPQPKRSADHGQLVHTGGMQKTTDLWHKSIDRIREASERQRRKIDSSNRQFLIFIAKLFLTLMIISGAGMFFLWNMLDTYEQSTPEGAMSDYVRLLTQQNYDLIYKRSFDGFTQWNDAQSYTAWLKNRYEGVDLQRAVFTRKSYSEDRYQYYDMLVDQKTIATLELSWLETENRWNARTLVEDRNFSIELFSSAEVLINGMPLTETNLTDPSGRSDAYLTLKDQQQSLPVTRYHIDGLVDVPEVTVSDPNMIVVKDALQDRFYVGQRPNTQQQQQMTQRIREAATTYAMMISEDASFSDLRPYLYRQSETYDALASFNNQYFSTHDSVRFDNVQVTDLIVFGDGEGFMGTISFDYIVTIEGQTSRTYSSTYQMTWLDVDGEYLCSNLVIANQE